MLTNDTISIADLRSDHAAAEAEAATYDEQARLARERCTRLASMIQSLEEWAEERQKRTPPPKPQVVVKPQQQTPGAGAAYRAPTAGEVAVRVLEEAGHPLPTRELARRIAAAGYQTNSKKPLKDAIYGTLVGALKVKGARLIRIGTEWGIREWQQNQQAPS
jgi:hypothetical protein